jgi:hypothetical protein
VAFSFLRPLTGDNKTVCTSLKKENATYRKASKGRSGGLQGSLNLSGTPPSSQSQNRLHEIEAMPEDSLAESTAKQEAYASWLQEAGSDPEQLAADLYTAAFFLPKTADTRPCVPTTEHLLKLQLGKPLEDESLIQAVIQASRDFRFFHWHLRFGEVMKEGGFDCLLGNPPWERIKLQEKEFFAARSEAIATAPNKAARERLIKALSGEEASETERALVKQFELAKREAEGSGEFIRGSGRFALTAVGDLNTYALFAEHFLNLIGPDGRAGLIVPTGIATDNSTKAYFDYVATGSRLASLISFFEIRKWFPGTDDRNPFCLLTLAQRIDACQLAFSVRALSELLDHRRSFTLSSDDFSLLNPNTRTCPVFRSQMDAELSKKIYSRVPVLIDEALGDQGNSWGIKFMTMFHMSNDSNLFMDAPAEDRLPLYEAKLIHHYDHHWATYDVDGSSRDVTLAEKQKPDFEIIPRYWVERQEVEARLKAQGWDRQWLMGWRDVCRNTDERTMVTGVLPVAGVNHKFMLYMPKGVGAAECSCLLGNLSSLVYDFLARQKVAGTSFSYFYIKQIPALPPAAFDSTAIDFIHPRVLELTYTSHDLKPWAQDLGYDGLPFRFDPERRALLRAELDAYYAHLYGLSHDELRYILDPADLMGPEYPSETFRVLKTNELRQFGEYRTQRLVLEAWDRLFGDR